MSVGGFRSRSRAFPYQEQGRGCDRHVNEDIEAVGAPGPGMPILPILIGLFLIGLWIYRRAR